MNVILFRTLRVFHKPIFSQFGERGVDESILDAPEGEVPGRSESVTEELCSASPFLLSAPSRMNDSPSV